MMNKKRHFERGKGDIIKSTGIKFVVEIWLVTMIRTYQNHRGQVLMLFKLRGMRVLSNIFGKC